LNAPGKLPAHRVVIGLGSNIDPENNLLQAFRELKKRTEILKSSGVWQNPAVGSEGPDYLNAAVLVSTTLDLNSLKTRLLWTIEKDLDRVRRADKNADRTIDLDILIVDGVPLDEELWTRAHVSVPAAQVAPHVRHPETGETLQEAARRLLPERNFNLRSDLALPSNSP